MSHCFPFPVYFLSHSLKIHVLPKIRKEKCKRSCSLRACEVKPPLVSVCTCTAVAAENTFKANTPQKETRKLTALYRYPPRIAQRSRKFSRARVETSGCFRSIDNSFCAPKSVIAVAETSSRNMHATRRERKTG